MNFILSSIKNYETFEESFSNFINLNKLDLPSIKNKKINGTGSQKINFFYIFGFLNHGISFQNDLYKQYYLLISIVNFLLYPEVDLKELNFFDEKAKNYLTLNKTNGLRLTPKTHHLVHYSDLIKKFGPLIYHSTLRFERAHQVGKASIASSRNYQNVPLSIAKSLVKLKTIENLNKQKQGSLLKKEYFEIDERLKNYSSLINKNIDAEFLDFTYHHNIKIKSKKIYVYNFNDEQCYEYPVFFHVDLILKQEKIKILGHLLTVDYFEKNKNSYKLKKTKNFKEFDLKKIPFYKTLKQIKTEDGSLYILKDFHTNFDKSRYLNTLKTE